ncbi:MAG: hypothetical protein GWN67_04100 [Phycisphaerae bacterium]|nr:hypothetical protein [Phycisphaerae bacterium]NIR62443.1 hypothetical protein [candidate division Zixibacteria bacterium]NIP55812.1 hypothetical protein [Phycisphaerae bacterium]NIS50300.1 hypothetical protein [Phycisphaerae bacterium]NIU08045.1 hypothetical protein [Phycisphaerae bacterium]
MDSKQLEKYTSAITLSDMEIFVFPELMYSLVLANIMSPIIWQWRQLDCFKKLEGKSSYRKLMRLKQFVMDEFDFNLDLETWGLTSKANELKRFERHISPDDIAKSNALFGYHGDKYYFDVDIRRHFGLDKYDSDIIPYWKTETIEAMNAFRLKKGYMTAAGECVSLAALYVAAAFIVCRIPLEDIYMILTPLHSQNFIDMQDGVLTNNRRLVTKTMWFNGTAISNKAQRALRNENVTIVAHPSGYVHCLYDDATIDRKTYEHFTMRLNSYLSTGLTLQIFANFLRSHHEYQKFFQLCRDCHGQPQFLKAETLFHYEHSSNFRIADATHEKLLAEVSDEDFIHYELPGRIRCDELEKLIRKKKVDVRRQEDRDILRKYFEPVITDARQFVEELADFIHIEAKLPASDKHFIPVNPIEISIDHSREQIIHYLQQIRQGNTTADLAFYAYRDMETCDWAPFIKAAVERNPVSLKMVESKSDDEVYACLEQMNDTSIYDAKRLAQPDEVVNYKTGDGLEKAFLLANVIRQRNSQHDIEIVVDEDDVILNGPGKYRFLSAKDLKKQIRISSDGAITVVG